jgi:PAS domain S-box-containing protein
MIPGTKRSIASMVDITSRVQAENALRRSEEKYRSILENIEEGYFELDLDGNLIFFNNSLCNVTGHSREELLGVNYKQYSSQESAEKMLGVFKQITRTGRPVVLADLDIYLKDGRVITVDLSATPIRTAEDQIAGFRGLMRDVSERKQSEQERQKLETKLQQAKKMKAIGTLAGGVAHDLNNILSGIVSYPDLILMDLPKDSPLVEPLRTIQESGKKAAAIVQDLLTLARRGVSISKVVNLNDIINEYLESPQLAKLKSFHPLVKVQIHLDSALLNIKGSPVHLSKTVMNLVSNAAEAMPEGGTVQIKAENQYIDRPIKGYDDVEEGDYVVLTVSDSGIGILPEEITQIFEPFYTKKVMGRSGTGLGMAVVWGTVKDHKGYIHVESDIGRLTVFKLYFPVTREQDAEYNPNKTSVDYHGNGESILIVDDVKEQREIASKILSQLGYSVKTAESGEQALELLKRAPVDLVVLDMIMVPGIDGLETYERIIELHPKQKAIIASGYSETDRVKKAQRLGAGRYVKKPYTVRKIGLAVKGELAKQKEAA